MKTFATGIVIASLCWINMSALAAPPATGPSNVEPTTRGSGPVETGPTIPAPRDKDAGWMGHHAKIVATAADHKESQLIFLGDSITDGWQNKPSFKENYGKYDALDQGISGDRTQHVLWRLENGEVEGLHPKVAVLMIGTNNVGSDKPAATAAGIKKILDTLHEKLPGTKVLLLAIFPREEKTSRHRQANDMVNEIIATYASDNVRYLDIGKAFLDDDGNIAKEIMADGLHPTGKGYDLWAKAMQPTLDEMMGGK